MITHEDWDEGGAAIVIPYTLPADVRRISVSYDGGRLSIAINGAEVFKASEGTRDCVVNIDSD